ncbi:GNAT family N-acetyltransferase [uncultured Phycicoccus sp.]|uniref:GNAT family N-acetyltransferase n=1 Tax=uncultured Phycicoccus sp. TaxID=661422 RepID=UPI002628AEF5|nr:GNAT family N-acetyltransferase [uncultured Phycicoccus sp.]
MSTLSWQPLSDEDLPALAHLAQRCLDRDGGLPQLAGEPMLRQLFLRGQSIGGRDEIGELVAAASVFVDGTGHRAATGLVDPSARRQGLGEQLVRWSLERSGGSLLRLVAETTSPESDALADHLGLLRTFAEHVMRHPLVAMPRVPRPPGLVSLPWSEDTAGLFHIAYTRSFASRPGFPDTPREEWVAGSQEDEDFRPELSRVVLDRQGRVAGFVTVTENWIDQVGVVPDWRGRGLGAHLVTRSLRALRKAGCEAVWLAVNVDNPAHDLYLRLGFEDHGLRARYEQTPD